MPVNCAIAPDAPRHTDCGYHTTSQRVAVDDVRNDLATLRILLSVIPGLLVAVAIVSTIGQAASGLAVTR